MSKWQLFLAFTMRQEVTVKGVSGVIDAIELEDGSGSSFNLNMRLSRAHSRDPLTGSRQKSIYLRTTD